MQKVTRLGAYIFAIFLVVICVSASSGEASPRLQAYPCTLENSFDIKSELNAGSFLVDRSNFAEFVVFWAHRLPESPEVKILIVRTRTNAKPLRYCNHEFVFKIDENPPPQFRRFQIGMLVHLFKKR